MMRILNKDFIKKFSFMIISYFFVLVEEDSLKKVETSNFIDIKFL